MQKDEVLQWLQLDIKYTLLQEWCTNNLGEKPDSEKVLLGFANEWDLYAAMPRI